MIKFHNGIRITHRIVYVINVPLEIKLLHTKLPVTASEAVVVVVDALVVIVLTVVGVVSANIVGY